MYDETYNCVQNYIGETGRNPIRRDKHCDIGKNSKAGKRLYQFPEHKFKLKILRRVRNKVTKRKIHQAYYLMCIRPFLNNHLESASFTLF